MGFKHYLNFLSLPSVGTIEIAEPIGFDGASYKVKQDEKRFGRDIIIANEDTELTFTRDYFEQIQITQILPSGETFNYASQGFDYLLDIFNNDGWEGKVEYIIEKDEESFTTGIFSYYTSVVEFDNIKVKIIQNTNREVLKRLEDTNIDAFNNKSLDGRDITPCATTNILLKAKPIINSSVWAKSYGSSSYLTFGRFYTLSLNRNITESAINNTLTPYADVLFHPLDGVNREMTFAQHMAGGTNYINAPEGESTKLLIAKNEITNINVKLKFKGNLRSRNGSNTSFIYYIMKSTPNLFYNNYASKNFEKVLEIPLTSSTFIDVDYDINFNSNITLFPGEILYGGYSGLLDTSFIDSNIINSEVSITSTETYIDTIIKGVRLIDLIKHNVKSFVDMPVDAPEYDLGGEHYDNFAFNGLLLGQITDRPFYTQFKDLMNIPMETCSDYQINPNSIEILPYSDYYEDTELAVFDELPSFTSNSMFSKQYTLKNAEFKYSRSSSERETNSKNSIDDVHTETQKYITDSVDGSLKVDIKHIRSAFLIEQARQRAFENQETTSLQNDDNLFLIKCVSLDPSSQGRFKANLLLRYNTSNDTLEILNNNTNGDGININWNLLGISTTQPLQTIINGITENWNIVTIANTILTLSKIPSGSLPAENYNGDYLIEFIYFYENVLFTNQTNEGYELIEGVANPNDYSNLDYSWGRNIKRWYPYLASATKFKPNGEIKTSSFKINGNLVTRKNGEGANVSDSADIDNSDIASLKILNPFNHSVKVYAPFNVVTQLIEDIRDVKGYVSVNLNDGRMIKGYIQNMEYTWITEELDLVLEEKFISDFMEIDLTVNIDNTTTTTITNPNYPTKTDLKSFQINNIFVTLYNSVDNELYPPTRFTNVKINGEQYTDKTLFSDALTELINAQNE
jgi:hypothetical protein